LFGVVAELTAERCYGLVDGVLADGDAGPDLVEEFLDADDFAGALGQAEEQTHCPHFEPDRVSILSIFSFARDLA
jgi:hypothetical protein